MGSRDDLQRRLDETEAELKTIRQELNLLNPKKSLSTFRRGDLPTASVSMYEKANLAFHKDRILGLSWVHGSAAYNPTTRACLITVSRDGEIIIWDSKTGSPIMKETMEGPDNCLMAVSLENQDNTMVCVAGTSGSLYVYRSRFTPVGRLFIDNKPEIAIKAHLDYVSDCVFLNKGEIVSASGDSTCRLWSAERAGPPIRTFGGHSASVKSLSISDVHSSCFLSGSLDESVKLWDVRRGQGCVRDFQIYSGVNSVKFMPGSCTTFAIGCIDAFSQLLDARALVQLSIYPFPNFQAAVTKLEFSKSGRLLFTAGEDGAIALWDTLDESSCMQTLTGHSEQISGLELSDDGRVLAAVSYDKALTLWEHRPR